MYFVTSKRAGYALFSMTQSERAAIGLTDDQQPVHLLERTGKDWRGPTECGERVALHPRDRVACRAG